MNVSERVKRPLYIRGWGAAMFLVARGIEPVGAEFARDGSGAAVYLFPASAESELAEYHRAKDRLRTIGENAVSAY